MQGAGRKRSCALASLFLLFKLEIDLRCLLHRIYRCRKHELRNIDFTRKPSKNLPLKGNVFDFAPGRVDFEVPEDCGLYIGGGADVKLENINTRAWKIIRA